MKKYFLSFLVLIVLSLSSCGWIHSLRSEVEEDPQVELKEARRAEFSNSRFTPPSKRPPLPPATVIDDRISPIAGTQVDLSGLRAKAGRITKNDFNVENARSENSLWSEQGQNNYLFARNKLKAPGDLVTVVIEEKLRKEMEDSIKLMLPADLRNEEIFVPGLSKKKDEKRSVAAAADPNDPNAPQKELSHEDMLTAEILERYPNGNLRLRGVKRIPFRRRVLDVEVTSIAKGADIDDKDYLKSSKFLEDRVELYK